MSGPVQFGIFVFAVWLAIKFLRMFDRVAGRGPKAVEDGVRAAKRRK